MYAEQQGNRGVAQHQRMGQCRRFAGVISVFAMAAIVALLCAGKPVLSFADDVADADFYAVLHADGTLVFQREQPVVADDSGASDVAAVYEGSLEGYAKAKDIPWLQDAQRILSVTFADDFKELQPASLAYWFTDCSNMTFADVTNLDASKSTTMQKMFIGCTSLSEIKGIEQLDTSSSTYFGSMFCGCASLTNLDLSKFDASNVEVLCFMFNGCSSLETINMSGEGWKTSSLRLMVHVWEGCSSLKSLDLSRLDTSGVSSMTCDFKGCTKLEYLNLSGIETASVGNLKDFFDGCDQLSTIVLGEGFTFNGSSEARQCSFPEGNWKSSVTDVIYAADEVPNNVAATYIKVTTPSGSDDASEGSDSVSPVDKGNMKRGLKKGATAKVAGVTYTVTNNAKATVAFKKAPKSKKTVTIPATVKLNKKKYAVTSVAKGAFKGAKTKTIVVKTKKLTKKSVVGCFKGASKLKTVKVPKAKRQAYTRYFKKPNSGRAIVVK